MLRKNIRSSVFVLLALAACTSKNNVKITGEIKEAENQKVYRSVFVELMMTA